MNDANISQGHIEPGVWILKLRTSCLLGMPFGDLRCCIGKNALMHAAAAGSQLAFIPASSVSNLTVSDIARDAV